MKKYLKFVYSVIVTPLLLFPNLSFSETQNSPSYLDTFDTYKNSELHDGWVIDETISSNGFYKAGKSEKLASLIITKDSNAPSGKNILTINKINNSASSVFNIIHRKKFKLKNGEISVKVRANSGDINQGGGPIWRFNDKNNYYVARYNPLEQNFRIYSVKDGNRIQLQSAKNIGIKKDDWFTIKIQSNKSNIIAWLNGKKFLTVKDNTHNETGGIRLWTKADTMSSFDNFSVVSK